MTTLKAAGPSLLRAVDRAATARLRTGSGRNADSALAAMVDVHCQAIGPTPVPAATRRGPVRQSDGSPTQRAIPNPTKAFRPDHRLLAYRTPREMVRATERFLRDGHQADDLMLVITDARKIDALRARVPAQAQVRWAESGQWFSTPGRSMAALHEFLTESAAGAGGVRVVSEPPWQGFAAEARGEWACWESALNVVMTGRNLRVLCAYRADAVGPQVLAQAQVTHPWLVRDDDRRASADWVEPQRFCPAGEAPLSPAPVSASRTTLQAGSTADVARFATRQAFELGVFGRTARNFGLAAHEAAAEFFPAGQVNAGLRVWKQGRELVCELDCAAPRRPRVVGYVPPTGELEESGRLWTARRLCRLVRLRPTPDGMLARLHHPID